MKLIVVIFFSFFFFLGFSQEGKKVQFVGGARSLISSADFTSNEMDTVTARKSTGGYALIDLGIKINPNANTEVLGMIRISNAFGGFWGSGVDFNVRQLSVKGVAANVVRYQIGNIDYKLSPYTFYNSNPDLLVQTSGATKIKEEILNYESFCKNNTWRQQGAAMDFALQFPKVIKEVKFNGFITRLNPSNFANILERLCGGGNMVLTQSKYAKVGANFVSVFDLKQTALSNDAYRNNVATIVYDFSVDKEKFKIGVDGESGKSSSFSTQNNEGALSDYFINAKAYANLKKIGLSLKLGYMDNGADFRSAGAQSKRMDFGQLNNFYERYTNDQIVRPLSYYDLYNDPTLYSSSFSTKIMDYNPAINNVLQYGIATFNRRGFFWGINYSDARKIVNIQADAYHLGEIRGQGTYNLRSFDFITSTVQFNASNLFKWKKKQLVQIGFAYQHTKRNSDLEFERIQLESYTANFGVELELVDQLFLIGNAFVFASKGNEILPVRDAQGEVVNFSDYTVRGQETCYSGGLKFNFTKDIYLSGVFETNSNKFNVANPYRYNQFLIYYVMKF
jgi:hypothetical protein